MKISITKIILIGLFLRVALMFLVWHPDINNHVDWGIRFFQYGASKFYAPESNVWSFTWPNQPPATILLFAGIYKLYLFLFSIVWWINVHIPVFPSTVLPFFEHQFYQGLLKLPSILSDLGIGYLIYKIFKDQGKEKLGKIGAAFFLFNPIIWYNSAVWGQTDAIINFLALVSLYFLLQRKLGFAAILLAISLYTKISLAIFVPLFVIITIRQKYKLKEYLWSLFFPILLIFSVTLLFSGKYEPIGFLYQLYTKKVLTDQLQIITANAFNLWAVIAGINEQSQTLPFLFLTYKIWGQILFAIAYIPLLFMLWKDQKPMRVFWIFALTAFSSWMFLTNMHERYLYPLFPFLTILVVENKKLRLIYWIISIISLLNLYNFWFVPRIEPIMAVMNFSDHLVARVFGIINLVLFTIIYFVGTRFKST